MFFQSFLKKILSLSVDSGFIDVILPNNVKFGNNILHSSVFTRIYGIALPAIIGVNELKK